MSLYKNKYKNEPKRLQCYDYSQAGSYFITVCTKDRLLRFGEIINGKLQNTVNENIVLKYWNQLPKHYSNIELGPMVVMPNHVHFIITIRNNDAVIDNNPVTVIHELQLQDNSLYGVGAIPVAISVDAIHELHLRKLHLRKLHLQRDCSRNCTPQNSDNPHLYSREEIKQQQFERRLQRRKMLLSKIVGRLKMQVAKEINIIENTKGKPFWQRSYYDRIIRDENEYERIHNYILNNPQNWENDRNNKSDIFM